MLLLWSGNMNKLLNPSSNPHRIHERNLHVWKKHLKECLLYVATYLACAFMKYLVIMTKRSNLSYYWICDTSIIWWFSHFQTCHIKAAGLYSEVERIIYFMGFVIENVGIKWAQKLTFIGEDQTLLLHNWLVINCKPPCYQGHGLGVVERTMLH